MSDKNTPGPWSYSPRGTTVTARVTREINGTIRTYEQKIATTPSMDRIERLANAQLISASPDLLDVAKRLIAWCDKEPLRGEALYFVALAREAVAKATGQ